MNKFQKAASIVKSDINYFNLSILFDREFELNGRTEKLIELENLLAKRLDVLGVKQTSNGFFDLKESK